MQFPVKHLVLLVALSLLNSAAMVLARYGGELSVRSGSSLSAPGAWLWSSRWWLVGLGVSWVCGLGYAWCLRHVPLTVALPIYVGLVYSASVVLSFAVLGERLGGVQTAGILVILAGLVMLTAPIVQGSSAPVAPQ